MNRYRSAFSLVELLVVISITTVLITLLLPAIGAARESANGQVCSSHLRQMGMAYAAYVNESKAWAPNSTSALDQNSVHGLDPQQCLVDTTYYGQSGDGTLNHSIDSVFSLLCKQYMNSDRRLLICPSQRADTNVSGTGQGANQWLPNVYHPDNIWASFYGSNCSRSDFTWWGTGSSDIRVSASPFGYCTLPTLSFYPFVYTLPNDTWHGVKPDDKKHPNIVPIAFDVGNYDYNTVTGVPNPVATYTAPPHNAGWGLPASGYCCWQQIWRGYVPSVAAGVDGTWGGRVSSRHNNQSANMIMIDGHVQNDQAVNIQQANHNLWDAYFQWNYLGENW